MISRSFYRCFNPIIRNNLKVFSIDQCWPKLHLNSPVTTVRNYAKSKDKGKDKSSKKSSKVEVNPLMMSELIDVEKMRTQCASVLEHMKEDFAKNLSLRSTTGSIETIRLRFEGKDYDLQELAQIVRKNPKTMILNFASFPNAVPIALKAIQNSGLNLNPQQDGTTLFIPVPKVTKEHRESLAKNAKMIFIKYRDQLRDIQNDFLKKTKKQSKVSEDLVFNVTQQINTYFEQQYNSLKNIHQQKHEELVGKT